MRIDRLMAIMNLLSEKKTVTAPDLAQRFEVSRRTINRDIEVLCQAGIPVVTKQGRNGGISLIEGYVLDKRLLRREELSDIITGLDGIESILPNKKREALRSRISDEETCMVIDLSSHYLGTLSEKIEQLKEAILAHKTITFDYYSPRGHENRKAEPYKIMYKWDDWYLLAYCLVRQSMRVFKLNRLWSLEVDHDNYFEPRELTEDDMNLGSHLTDKLPVEVLFDKSVAHIVVEEYGPFSYTEDEDGKLHFKGYYTNEDFIVRWILGFGNKANVIGPEDLVEKVKKSATKF